MNILGKGMFLGEMLGEGKDYFGGDEKQRSKYFAYFIFLFSIFGIFLQFLSHS